jgi:hypothetical protein
MKKNLLPLLIAAGLLSEATAQTNPAITYWLVNTTNIRGRHYVAGNPTPIQDTAHANVQLVRYSNNNAYLNASGIPSYIIGPYQDGNPAQGTNRNYLFKIPLNPTPNTGTLTNVGMGHIGVFINGVPMFNYADGRSWNNQGIWNRDAIFWERLGFDCAKGHPAPVMGQGQSGGSYHHHQNPSAFNLDLVPVSTVCDLYPADGLYLMDSTQHSPLIGFAFDGFPVYGPYGFSNTNGTGGIKRMQSSYPKRNITDRTTLPNGTVLPVAQQGPSLAQYPLGAFKEDFTFTPGYGDLDEHNGRFCITPEYPNGIYCYFATVDENQNSYYPYLLGPTYYGVVTTANFGTPGQPSPTNVTVNEAVTTYNPLTSVQEAPVESAFRMTLYPNPASEFVAIQLREIAREDLLVELLDVKGALVQSTMLYQGSTLCYFDLRTVYNGAYFVRLSNKNGSSTSTLVVKRD